MLFVWNLVVVLVSGIREFGGLESWMCIVFYGRINIVRLFWCDDEVYCLFCVWFSKGLIKEIILYEMILKIIGVLECLFINVDKCEKN